MLYADTVSSSSPFGMMAARINREVPIPYYYQLENQLRQEIEAGGWPTDRPIYSERQLCEMYDVSRTTVRQAVGRLVHEGLLYHVKGKGTFIRRP
jgi:GntR family transcriptional regulator